MRGKNGEPWRLTSQPGLKEATPELGETRFNRDILKQHHNNMNHHEYKNLIELLQYMLNTTINNTMHSIRKQHPKTKALHNDSSIESN